ncbi:hypothetical protein DDZ13_08340 [Coraliomargarita sinensis]|uniref:Uncharacterized protein n=1 Tax=Coraliomargarita sinensis TaxID=2174842 RepID=A0A317ZIK0_9BACT|nr:OadG family transporter subunit [Coraliomargarita sinensis]PXA04043.1 hypothetical protein DDZ13_08340 [Coraliomargarita sinensis]
MIHSISVLAQLAGDASAGPKPGGVVIVGFLFVVIVLALLASVTSAIGAWFTKQAAKNAAQAAAAAKSTAEAFSQSASAGSASSAATEDSATGDKTDTETDDSALMAVIAAAVHTVIGDRPHRVVSIRSSGPGWAQEGRRQIFSSHRVR